MLKILKRFILTFSLLFVLAAKPVNAYDFDHYSLTINSEKFELETSSSEDLEASVYFYDGNIISAVNFEASDNTLFSTSYCSGDDCVNISIERLILKIDNGQTIQSYWFSYDQNQLSLEFDDTSLELNLDSDEEQWLRDPQSLDKVVITNPDLCPACGLDIALVIDSSGSIDNQELSQMKQAFNSFVDAFLPNTPSQFAVVEFDNTVRLVQDFSTDPNQVKAAINQAQRGGMTNWQSALNRVKSLDFAASLKPDLVIFASDGRPTWPESNVNINLDLARQEANELKLDRIRILTLGIGNNLSSDNLAQISGRKIDQGMLASDVITTDFDQLASDLSDLAYELCAGKIVAQVQIDGNADGDLDDDLDLDGTTASDYLNQWQIEVTGSPTVMRQTNQSGFTEFELDPNHYYMTGQTGEAFQLQSLTCYKGGQEIGQINGLTADQLDLGIDDTISCYFVYEPVEPWLNEADNPDQDSGSESEDEVDASEDQTASNTEEDEDSQVEAESLLTDDDQVSNEETDQPRAGQSAQISQGQVLGASTQQLPATGFSFMLLTGSVMILIIGVILEINEHKNQK